MTCKFLARNASYLYNKVPVVKLFIVPSFFLSVQLPGVAFHVSVWEMQAKSFHYTAIIIKF